jgi:hypothetical protein
LILFSEKYLLFGTDENNIADKPLNVKILYLMQKYQFISLLRRRIDYKGTLENINKDASSLYLTYDQEIVLEDLNNFEFRSFGRINAQYQEKTDNVRMASKPIISNEIVDANTQDKNSIG